MGAPLLAAGGAAAAPAPPAAAKLAAPWGASPAGRPPGSDLPWDLGAGFDAAPHFEDGCLRDDDEEGGGLMFPGGTPLRRTAGPALEGLLSWTGSAQNLLESPADAKVPASKALPPAARGPLPA